MKRLVSAIKCDFRLQFRHGFYHIYAIITAVYIVGLRLAPAVVREILLPLLVFSDPGMLGFFFIAAIVMFEKDSRSLQALSITPLRPSEYLLAKAVSLSTLAILASIVVAGMSMEFSVRLLLLIPAVSVCGALVVFAGFILVARHKTFSHFILESIPILMAISIPLLQVVGLVRWPFLYLFPSYPPLAAIWGLFQGSTLLEVSMYTLLTAIWGYVFYRLALRAYTRHIVGRC